MRIATSPCSSGSSCDSTAPAWSGDMYTRMSEIVCGCSSLMNSSSCAGSVFFTSSSGLPCLSAANRRFVMSSA